MEQQHRRTKLIQQSLCLKSELEQTIIVDLSQGTVVTLEPSDIETMSENARSSLFLYSGNVNFGTSKNSVYSPVLVTPFSSGSNKLKFKPSNFDSNSNHQIDVTLYTHFSWGSANEYTSNELGILRFNVLSSYKILFSGTAASDIDKVYLEFTPHDDCAKSFSYELSIV